MKKLIALTLALACMLPLVSCQKKTENEKAIGGAITESSSADAPFWQRLRNIGCLLQINKTVAGL